MGLSWAGAAFYDDDDRAPWGRSAQKQGCYRPSRFVAPPLPRQRPSAAACEAEAVCCGDESFTVVTREDLSDGAEVGDVCWPAIPESDGFVIVSQPSGTTVLAPPPQPRTDATDPRTPRTPWPLSREYNWLGEPLPRCAVELRKEWCGVWGCLSATAGRSGGNDVLRPVDCNLADVYQFPRAHSGDRQDCDGSRIASRSASRSGAHDRRPQPCGLDVPMQSMFVGDDLSSSDAGGDVNAPVNSDASMSRKEFPALEKSESQVDLVNFLMNSYADWLHQTTNDDPSELGWRSGRSSCELDVAGHAVQCSSMRSIDSDCALSSLLDATMPDKMKCLLYR